MATVTGPVDPERCPAQIVDKMDDYLLGRLSAEDQEKIEVHVFDCQSCFEELRLRRDLRQLLKSEGRDLMPEYFSPAESVPLLQRNIGRYVTWGIAACLTIVVLAKFLFNENSQPQTRQMTFTQLLAQLNTNEDGPFAANSNLEDRLSGTYRSRSDISYTTPDTLVYRPPQQFRWEMDDSGIDLVFIIVNNRMNEMIRKPVAAGTGSISLDKELPPGRYYWLLESDRETLHVGRFLMVPGN